MYLWYATFFEKIIEGGQKRGSLIGIVKRMIFN